MAGAEAQTRPASAGLRLLSLLAALAPAPANAGAWIAPDEGQEIWTSVVGERDELSFFESALYLELPVAHGASFVLAPWVEQNYDTLDGWRGEALVGFKRTVFEADNTVVAIQAGALWVSHPDSACSEGGAEVRVLGGRAFASGSSFVNLEAAARGLVGGCEGARLDLTLGYRPNPDWLAMGQIFLDAPLDGRESVKAQITLVRFRDNGNGFQIGLRGRIDGEALEPALVLGLWGRPGD